MTKVINKFVYSLLVVVLCASLSSNRVYASQPSYIDHPSINNPGTIISLWQNQVYDIIGDTSAFLNYYDAKISAFILESIDEGYVTFTKFSEWHERKFTYLYYDVHDITSRAGKFVADHASIGIRNTKKYSKQYSQELVSEVGSNSSTLGSLIKLSYEQVLFNIGNLPNSMGGAFDRVVGVVDSMVATWQRDGRALAQFSRSVQFTTTGQTLASQELEKHSAFSDIVPVIRLPKVTVGNIQNFSNNILDSVDIAFHSYVVNDLISSQDRVIISAKTISEEAQAVVVDVDMGIVASLDVLLNKISILAESLGRKADYGSVAILDSSLFASLSTNGKYLHDNFSQQIVENDFSSQIKIANADSDQSSGRVLGDSVGVSWVGKVWCWLIVCPETEPVPVIVDEQDEAFGRSTAITTTITTTTTTTTVNVEEGVIESAVTRVMNRFIALGFFDFLEGDKGDTGETGQQGPQGSQGATGERGPAGSSSVSSGSSFDSSELVIGSGTLDASAILQANSTSRGFLAPRMTTAERDAISSPATGLLVYNTTTDAFNTYNGATWGAIGGGTTNLATDVTGVLAVSNGGTGASSLTLNGVVYGNGTSAVQVTAAPTSGQLLIGNVSGVPVFVSVSGDIAVDNTGVTTIQSNSVALGTDTAGNYVATISGDSQISVSGSGSETAAISLSVTADSIGDSQLAFNTGQHLTTTSSPTFAGISVVGTAAVGLSYTNSAGHALVKVDGDAASQAGYYIHKAGVEKVQIAVLGGSDDLSISMAGTERFLITSVGNVQLDGDLTISGDDLFMGTNTSGFILVADGTNFNPVAMSGDITIDSTGATSIGADKVTEADLKAVDSSVDEECLTYESTTGDFEWQSCGSGTMAIGGSITSATQGSILFAGASGVLAQDNASLFFNDSTNDLGIGISPTSPLHVYSIDGSGSEITLNIENAGTSNGHPIIGFTENSVFAGSIIGVTDTGPGFGLINGLTISAPSGKEIGIRIDITQIASFGVLSADGVGNAFTLNGTFATAASAQQDALDINLTTAGSAAQRQVGISLTMAAGYTGSSAVFSNYTDLASASTGNGLNTWAGNFGYMSYVHGTTSGLNVGSGAWVENGNTNIAILGQAPTNKGSATNVGVMGHGLNGGASGIQIGGYFGLVTASTPQIPTVSGALIANNGSQTSDIFVAQDNGSAVFTIANGGTMSLTSANTNQVTTASAATFNLNSLTTGTGLYAASSTLSSGKLVDLQVSGTAATSNTQTVLNILNAGATSSSAQTTYGAQISNTRTNATSGTNVALYLNASGATTANYGLIVNSGRVGIGITTPSYPLHVVLGAAGVVARFTDSDGSCDIDPTSTALVCTSDQRLKEDVMTIESALEKVLNFRGVNFRWKSQTDNALRIGFLAQEIEVISPELVKTDPKTGLKSVNYVGFTPILVNAIHEQQEQIDNLQLAVSGVQGELAGNINQPILLKSHLYLTSDSVGQAQILSGDREVRINFDKPYEYQPIVTISARGEAALDNNFRYAVVDEDASGFTIKISEDQNEAIEFNWHAFAGQGVKLTVSNGNINIIKLVVAGQQSSESDPSSEDLEAIIDEGSVAGAVSEEFPDEQVPAIESEEDQEEPEVQNPVESGTEVSLAE